MAESLPVNFITIIGKDAVQRINVTGRFVLFLSHSVRSCFLPPHRPYLVFQAMEFLGNKSLGIILISGFFIGAVFTLQIGSVFSIFGAEGMMGAATGKALTREMSPLMTGFLLAGRGGAAITAEIATMRVNEQIDAMESMGVDPVSYLVAPRLIAALIMTPILTGIFNVIGQVGSLVVGTYLFDVDLGSYFDKLVTIVRPEDIAAGLQKAVGFGAVIAVVSCWFGIRASGGAKGVGQATTNSVVISLLMLLCLDYIITYFQIAY